MKQAFDTLQIKIWFCFLNWISFHFKPHVNFCSNKLYQASHVWVSLSKQKLCHVSFWGESFPSSPCGRYRAYKATGVKHYIKDYSERRWQLLTVITSVVAGHFKKKEKKGGDRCDPTGQQSWDCTDDHMHVHEHTNGCYSEAVFSVRHRAQYTVKLNPAASVNYSLLTVLLTSAKFRLSVLIWTFQRIKLVGVVVSVFVLLSWRIHENRNRRVWHLGIQSLELNSYEFLCRFLQKSERKIYQNKALKMWKKSDGELPSFFSPTTP